MIAYDSVRMYVIVDGSIYDSILKSSLVFVGVLNMFNWNLDV